MKELSQAPSTCIAKMKQAEEHESNGFRAFGIKDFICSVKFKERNKLYHIVHILDEFLQRKQQ